jgi:hypothetical protein
VQNAPRHESGILPHGGITHEYIQFGAARAEMERSARVYAEAAVRHGTAGQAFRAEVALAADRLTTNAYSSAVEPFAWQVDAMTTAASFGNPTFLNEPAASALFRGMDARPGSSYWKNVGFVGGEYVKGISQYQLFESGVNYAYDRNLETARAFGEQAGNAGLTAAALASTGITVRRAPAPHSFSPGNWLEHQEFVGQHIRVNNPDVLIHNQVNLRVIGPDRFTAKIQPDYLVQTPRGWEINEAKFSSSLNLADPNVSLQGALTNRQATAFGWIANGRTQGVVPFGQNAINAGFEVNTPITISPTVQIYVNGPNGVVPRRLVP